MSQGSDKPIGIFDSGIGGLTVLKELLRAFPHERFIYVGDTARVPYGTKSPQTVLAYSKQIVEFLIKKRVKMIVAACNTASALAIPLLKKEVPIPLVGVVEATAQLAAHVAPKGLIGVLATRATTKSGVYIKELKILAPKAKVMAQACPLLVPLVEEGWINHPITREVIRGYLRNLVKKKPNAVILGCTHYPILKPLIAEVFDKTTVLVDSPKAVAKTIQRVLDLIGRSKNLSSGKHKTHFFVSDDPEGFKRSAKLFLKQPLLEAVNLAKF